MILKHSLMRFLVTLFLIPAVTLSPVMVAPAAASPKFAAMAVDARTGAILFASDVDGLRHPASLTKMMTLYVLFQDLKAGRISRSTPLHVSARAASMAPSKLGLKAGSTISVDDAIKGLVTRSANDAAATIAENLGGTESNYAARMTRVAHAIGMSKSNFANASGLPNPAQITTARDMATLGLRLMRDFPQYYPYFRIQSFVYKGQVVRTHNALVGHFEGTDGIKTGYIAEAGYNLVTSTRRGDKRLVGVVLGARSTASRNGFMVRMCEKLFDQARPGNTIASLPGSMKGIINPVDTPASQPSAVAAKTVESTTDQLALASAAAAKGPVDTQTTEDQAQAAAPEQAPKVLQASLEPVPSLDRATAKITKLPFKVESTSDTPATLASTYAQSWNIQVGAYPDKALAEAKLTSLRGDQNSKLSDKSAYTLSVKKGSSRLYRARFAGFESEAEAKQACKIITRSGETCLTVSPQS